MSGRCVQWMGVCPKGCGRQPQTKRQTPSLDPEADSLPGPRGKVEMATKGAGHILLECILVSRFNCMVYIGLQ